MGCLCCKLKKNKSKNLSEEHKAQGSNNQPEDQPKNEEVSSEKIDPNQIESNPNLALIASDSNQIINSQIDGVEGPFQLAPDAVPIEVIDPDMPEGKWSFQSPDGFKYFENALNKEIEMNYSAGKTKFDFQFNGRQVSANFKDQVLFLEGEPLQLHRQSLRIPKYVFRAQDGTERPVAEYLEDIIESKKDFYVTFNGSKAVIDHENKKFIQRDSQIMLSYRELE